ncbi:MAG: hypothetical protein ACJ0E5_00040 [Gammaproteobacteria bacterium]
MPEIIQPVYLAIFSSFFLLSLIVHFVFRILFKRLNIVDKPDGIKKKHKKAVPISGGISIVTSLVLIAVIYFFLDSSELIETLLQNEKLKINSPALDIRTGLLIGFTGLIVAVVSFFDDILELPIWFRFMTLILCSSIVISLSNLSLSSLGDLLGFGEIKLDGIYSTLITVFCIVGVANAFNWIDGLDGLFSSQVLIAIGSIFYFVGGNGVFLILFLLAFLPYMMMNAGFFGESIKVFIGDHGAMALGYSIGWMLVSIAEFGAINPITAPWIIGLVLLNAIRVMYKRLLLGVSLFRSDREHIHHFFLDNNYSRRLSLLIIVLISSSIALTGLLFQAGGVPESVAFVSFLGIFVVWSFLSYSLNKKIRNQGA